MAVAEDCVDVFPVLLDDVEAIDVKGEIIGVFGRDSIDRYDIDNRKFFVFRCEIKQLFLEVRPYFFDLEMRIVECDDFVDECLVTYHNTAFLRILFTLFCTPVISVSLTTAVTVMFWLLSTP